MTLLDTHLRGHDGVGSRFALLLDTHLRGYDGVGSHDGVGVELRRRHTLVARFCVHPPPVSIAERFQRRSAG